MGTNKAISADQILSVDEVAAYLGLSPVHVRYLARTKQIRAQAVSRAWIFRGSDVIGWQPERGPGRPPKES